MCSICGSSRCSRFLGGFTLLHLQSSPPSLLERVESGELQLLVDEKELDARRALWQPDDPHYTRGYAKLYIDHVLQADQGADLDFLVGKDTRLVTRESH